MGCMDSRNRPLLAALDADLAVKAGTGALALGVAEALYHFRSFSLEALAFLATWYVLWCLATALTRRPRRPWPW